MQTPPSEGVLVPRNAIELEKLNPGTIQDPSPGIYMPSMFDERTTQDPSPGIPRRAIFDENGRLLREQRSLSSKQYGFLLLLFAAILTYLTKTCTTRFESFKVEKTVNTLEGAFYAFFPQVAHIAGFITCWTITFILTLRLQLVLQIFFGLLWLCSATIYFVQLVEKTSASGVHVTSGDSFKLPVFWFAIIQAVGFSLIIGLVLFVIVYLSWKLVHKANPRVMEVNVLQQNYSTWWSFNSYAFFPEVVHIAGFIICWIITFILILPLQLVLQQNDSTSFYAFFPEVVHIAGFIICWIITFILILPLQRVLQIFFGLLWLCSTIIYFVQLVQKTSTSGVHVASGETLKLPVFLFAIIQAVGFSLIIGLLLFIIVYLSWKFFHKANPRNAEVNLPDLASLV